MLFGGIWRRALAAAGGLSGAVVCVGLRAGGGGV